MKKITAVFLVSALAMAGCKKEFSLERIDAKVDRKVTKRERNALIEDTWNLLQAKVEASPGSVYSHVFDGTGHDAVVRYLDERINYIVSKNTKLESRIVEVHNSLNANATAKVYNVATNIGTALWLVSLTLPQETKIAFRFGDRAVPLNQSRVGIIQLGEGYTKTSFFGKPMLSSVHRQATLVHEARHSDCTGGITKADVEQIRLGKLPENRSCGHLHDICPAGHQYAGHAACDVLPWGAYAVEAVFALGIAKACTNCSELDKQLALTTAIDSFSRVAPLEDMVSGRLGPPNMSSSGVLDE
jgi:hypothetical protein